jgi:hypothetical protein
MTLNEMNGNKNIPIEITEPIEHQPERTPDSRLRLSPEPELNNGPSVAQEPEEFATRADLAGNLD